MKVYKSDYTVKQLYKDTYAITDSGLGQGKVFMYLLVGKEKALLVDSGFGLLDLKAIIGSITDKQVICVCTHGHVDHALGACQFSQAFIHSKDFDVYRKHSSPELLNEMATKGLTLKPGKSKLNNPSYINLVEKMVKKSYPELKSLDDIKHFDLGERIITWYHVPGHTQGTIAFIDKSNSTAFDADACAPGAWLFLDESSPLPLYLEELKKYQAFLKEQGINKRYVGHSGKALREKYLGQLIRCTEIAISKPKKGIKMKTLLGNARIVFAGGSLLFCKRHEDEV